MRKEKTDMVLVILLYRNMTDIIELLESLRRIAQKIKVILVNNYYDEQTKQEAVSIAKKYDCHFVDEQNRGYGAGNNAGIKCALENYVFQYLIVANPDTVIRQFNTEGLLRADIPAVYAPKIVAATGKKQNPNWVVKDGLIEYLQYVACKNNTVFIDYLAIALLKFQRIIFNEITVNLLGKLRYKVYSAHGSFVIFSYAAILKLHPVYDENIFLFYEEICLAYKAKELGIPTYYVDSICIDHKEDGSMKLTNVNQKKMAQKSVVYYYENIRKAKHK